MPLKFCSWARVGSKWPVGRVATFGNLKTLALSSTCPMFTHRGVMSIEALCQAAHSLGCLDFHSHTLYKWLLFGC